MRLEQEDRKTGWDADEETDEGTFIMLMGTCNQEWVIFTAANPTPDKRARFLARLRPGACYPSFMMLYSDKNLLSLILAGASA